MDEPARLSRKMWFFRKEFFSQVLSYKQLKKKLKISIFAANYLHF